MGYIFFITLFFFFNDTATTEIYTLSLHDALPIPAAIAGVSPPYRRSTARGCDLRRSEEHTSELCHQIISYAVFCLKKKKKKKARHFPALQEAITLSPLPLTTKI